MTRPGLRVAIALLGLPGVMACGAATGGAGVLPGPRLPPVLDTVSRGTPVLIVSQGQRFSGTLSLVSADSLMIDRDGYPARFARAAVDTVWVRGRRSHHGTALGLGLGLGVSAAIVTQGHRSDDGGATFQAALLVGLMLLGFGALADVASPYSWTAILPVSTFGPGAIVVPTPVPRAEPTDTVP